jgi:hypothetical protein
LDSDVKLAHPSFGYDTEGQIMLPNEIKEFNQILGEIKIHVPKTEVTNEMLTLNYEKYINLLTSKKDDLLTQLRINQTALNDLSAKETLLKGEIAELKDRKRLSEKHSVVITNIENLKKLGILDSNSNSFNTRSISLKTSEAREELVRNNFNTIFKKELDALRKSHLEYRFELCDKQRKLSSTSKSKGT